MRDDLINNGNIYKEEQHFFVNSTEIPGVQSIEASFTQNMAAVNHIGLSGITYIPRGPQEASVSVSSLFITNDQFINLTGNTGINGFIVKGKGETASNFSFTSGYLTAYSTTCSIGQIPQINAAFNVYGNMGKLAASESATVSTQLTQISTNTSTSPLRIADPGSMSINLGEYTTNRLQSYSLNINVNRLPVYILGSRLPARVEINYPMEVNLSFTIEQNDYTPEKLRDFPFNEQTKSVTIVQKDLKDSSTIATYGFSGLKIVSENYGTNVNGATTITTSLKGYLL